MLRQLSATRRKALPSVAPRRGRHKNVRRENYDCGGVVRVSSGNPLCRTVGRFEERQRRYFRHHVQHHHQQRRQQGGGFSFHHNCTDHATRCDLSRRDLPSFHRLRACYFSNAAERTLDDENADDDAAVHVGGDQAPDQAPVHANQSTEHEGDPGLNHVGNLKLWYLDHHGEIGSVVQDAFETKMVQNPSHSILVRCGGDTDAALSGKGQDAIDAIQQIFTASFTCPVTNERYEAGRLSGYFDIGDQNFYSKKKVALQAVSAVVLHHKMGASDSSHGNPNTKAVLDNGEEYSYRLPSTNDQNSLRQRLQALYMEKFKVSPTKSQSRMTKQCFVGKEQGGSWWTAAFVCPVTSRIYEAGDLPTAYAPDSMKMNKAGQIWYRKKSDAVHASAYTAIDSIDWDAELSTLEEDKSKTAPAELEQSARSTDVLRALSFWFLEQQGHTDLDLSIEENFVVTAGTDDKGREVWTASFLCPLTGERFDSGTINTNDAVPVAEIDHLNWYTDRDTALRAASLRAYDAFHFRDTGVTDPRFCREDPTDFTTGNVRVGGEDIDNDSENDEDTYTADDLIGYEEDEEDFIIEVIPQQLNLSRGLESGSSKTLDIIAQAWIDSTVVPSSEESPKHEIQKLQNIYSERQRTINRAMEWVSKQKHDSVKETNDRTQFDVTGRICNLKIANAILSSLAKNHQRIPFDSRPAGVEKCAAAILESMWSSESTIPDAQSYALYLKCLEGETAKEVAGRAQEIISAMESGDEYNGRFLPKPNEAVHSILAELNALAGISPPDTIRGCESLDRNVHLCHLSAMAHNPTMFDAKLAIECIDQMRTLSETHNCPSLQPDIEAYNAPLRWSGGSLRSRLYSRVIPWDSYSEIFEDGFVSESNAAALLEKAAKVEEWIEMMKSKTENDDALAPNIETYESLIQAWVRCGSMESLLRAETIANNLIAGDYPCIRPRLQTFYPIIGAWVYSGCDEGPQSVESWIDRILLLQLEPDIDSRLGFPHLSIMSQLSLQRQILKQSGDTPDSMSRIKESAIKSNEILRSIIEEQNNAAEFRIGSDMFMLVINAWCNVASTALSQNIMEEVRQCSREIQKVVNLFDEMLISLNMADDSQEENQSKYSRLLNEAPSVYGAQIAALNKLQTDFDVSHEGSWSDDGLRQQQIFIEEKIRRLEEFNFFFSGDKNVKIADSQNCNSEVNIMSPFPNEVYMTDPSCRDWADFIYLSLDSIEKGTNNFSHGEADFLRICTLITRVTSSAMPSVLTSESRDQIFHKVIDLLEIYGSQNQDRMTVVSTLVQSLKKRVGTQQDKETKSLHGCILRCGTNEQLDEEDANDLTVANVQTKRKMRRKRSRGNELQGSSYSRSRVPNRSLSRRSRSHRVKSNN